jgi:hypothetical protein
MPGTAERAAAPSKTGQGGVASAAPAASIEVVRRGAVFVHPPLLRRSVAPLTEMRSPSRSLRPSTHRLRAGQA